MASNKNNIVYIAREIDRALGKAPIDNYFIVSNSSEQAKEIKSKYPDNVLLIESTELLDTYELMMNSEVADYINKIKAKVIVFKNTAQIESLCKSNNWEIINPSAELSERIENKISQIEWLGELASLLPPHSISTIKDIEWNDKPFIIQWSHGHTGEGTQLIKSESELATLKNKFPQRQAKITNFINGPVFTVNIVVTNTVILLGNISYQITGMLPFTDNIFSTIGNDWSVPHTILTEAQLKSFENMAQLIGQRMQKDNWKGLFGIDVIYDEERNSLYLIEINARQPASTTYESELQSYINMHGVDGLTTFEAHLISLQNLPVKSALIPINDGAQIVQRVTNNAYKSNPVKLIEAGYNVIIYKNTKPNADLIRIQSLQGIMETHNKFNKRGKQILELI